ANAALARYLGDRNVNLHLVAHQVDPEFLNRPNIAVHLVPRSFGSDALGAWPLARRGRKVARDVMARWRDPHVLVNGGNCSWPDVNWVHFVHHAWTCVDRTGPAWVKAKDRMVNAWGRRQERRAMQCARLVIANSDRTRRDVIERVGIEPGRLLTIHLGSDPGWRPPTAAERTAARARVGAAADRPLAVFVGALGSDQRKGFDTLWTAWRRLCAGSDWDVDLVVAGGGRTLRDWRQHAEWAGLAHRTRFLGFTDRVFDLLAAADVLVSPVRYEAYGLNVQEAICRGVPALVSADAGIADRYPPSLADMILPDPNDAQDLAARMIRWRSDIDGWKRRIAPLSDAFRRYTWADMAATIVAAIERPSNGLV
ncbi:MAG: glycosyltransferase family 4 protein, partial [Phycisphaeraceae bacterium]